MSNMTSESEDRMQSTDCINSPSDEASTERNMMGNGTLKKGPWTSAEDAILMEYVSKNGQGNWNAVQKDSGLSRCGKSCRLRWANHLRPDLKKGAFTPEEERRIIELHAKMGNKWARMAIELPGRTDNEIKNFWNTRTKRRQRAGLPIYPPDICLQTLSDNTQSHPYPNRDTEIIPNNNFQIPGVEFKNFALNQDLLFPHSLLHLPGPTFLDIPTNTLLPQTLGPTSHNNNSFLFPVSQSHPPKRIRRYPIYDGGGGGGGDLNDIFPANLYDDHVRSGSHAYLNGKNTSSSDPISWAMKMELPSLQYISTTQLGSGSCGPPSSPLPSLESVDTLVQSSTLIGQEKSTDRNSGLLEAVLYESQTLKKSKRDNTSSDDWEEAYVDAMSPLGHSSASVFSEYTPHVSDEHHSLEAISVKQESDEKSKSKSNHMKYCRPDLLLENSWFGSMSGSDHCGLIDPIGDDFCNGLSHLVGPGAIDGSPFDDESAKWDEIS